MISQLPCDLRRQLSPYQQHRRLCCSELLALLSNRSMTRHVMSSCPFSASLQEVEFRCCTQARGRFRCMWIPSLRTSCNFLCPKPRGCHIARLLKSRLQKWEPYLPKLKTQVKAFSFSLFCITICTENAWCPIWKRSKRKTLKEDALFYLDLLCYIYGSYDIM